MAKRLEKEDNCSVCLNGFQEPKVLPCCHSFCLKCLEGILERAEDKKTIDCPRCKTKHQVPPRGPQGFIEDYTISEVEIKKKQPLVCDQCEERGKAVSYCPTCTEYLCEECLRAHKRLKAYKSHDTVSIIFELFPKVKQRASRTYNCSIHPKKRLELYCKTCSTLACLHCFVGSHNGHDIGSIDQETRNQEEKAIKELVKQAESKLEEFEQNLQYIAEIEEDVNEQSLPLKAAVDKKIDSLITELEARRTELHKKIDDEITKDKKEVWAQKEYHETSIVSLKGALHFARQSLNCQEDTELLALCSQVCARLKELSQLNWDSQSIRDIEMKEIKFDSYTSSIQEFTRDIQTVRALWDHSSYSTSYISSIQKLTGDIQTARALWDRSSLNITLQCTKDMSSNILFRKGCKTTCQIKAVTQIRSRVRHDIDLTGWVEHNSPLKTHYAFRHDNDDRIVTMEKNEAENTWTVTLTPPKPGDYTITFTAQGKYRGETFESNYTCRVQVQSHFLDFRPKW